MKKFKETGQSPVDMGFLEKVEANYSHFKTLNLQLMSLDEKPPATSI